jgi:hypothetical protein
VNENVTHARVNTASTPATTSQVVLSHFAIGLSTAESCTVQESLRTKPALHGSLLTAKDDRLQFYKVFIAWIGVEWF